MEVGAPNGITRFYYFAYWVMLFVSGAVFWVSCNISPPAIMYSGSWKESRNYIRPEEDGGGAEDRASAEGGDRRVAERKETAQETVIAKA